MSATIQVTRAIPNLVKRRGIGAIRDWSETDRPFIGAYGCEYHCYKSRPGRPNVIGFWTRDNGFRPTGNNPSLEPIQAINMTRLYFALYSVTCAAVLAYWLVRQCFCTTP